MLPERLLRTSVRGQVLAPAYLGDHDHPWLRALVDDLERCADLPVGEVDDRLRRACSDAPAGKQALAIHVLRRACRVGAHTPVPPRKVRAELRRVRRGFGLEPAPAVALVRPAAAAPLPE